MNPIFQDRDITVRVLHPARMASQEHLHTLTRRVPAMAGNCHHSLAGLGIDTQEQVGKTFANWSPDFANWIQLANPCQLNFLKNQALSVLLEKLEVGSWQKLPTELSPCFHSLFTPSEVGENCPLPTGEGPTVPSTLVRRVAADDDLVPGRCQVTLAIDLGTTTGWALRALDGQIAHGFVSFRPQRFEGGGMRYLRFKGWLTEIKALAIEIHAVYFEEVRRHAGVDAAHVYGGLMATLTTWCEHHNVPYQGVPVGTIKKHATGKGNASKDEVIAAMRALGHPVTDDNEADALAILHWAIDTQEV